MAIRILLLTQWFDPEPTFKGLLFARELVKRGFEVEVVTGFPNYPGGILYPGYKIKLIQREVIEGVNITRVPLYANHDSSAIKRILNYVSFSAAALIYSLFKAKRPDVIYAYHPPLTVGIAAILIRLFRRIPVVYDIQDMWPDTLRISGMLNNERALHIVGKVCQLVYRYVDLIVVLSPGFKDALKARGVSDKKLKVIYNWADETDHGRTETDSLLNFPSADYFRILFAGNMGKGQGLDSVIAAAALLELRFPKIRFVLIGSGVESDRLKHSVKDKGLENVIFLPRVSMVEIGSVLSAADALLVHLVNAPLFQITIPSKTQAYMAVGKPILMAVSGDAAMLIKQAECGTTAQSENPQSIAEAAITLANYSRADLDEMGRKAKSYYQTNLSLQVGVDQFAVSFKKLADQRLANY